MKENQIDEMVKILVNCCSGPSELECLEYRSCKLCQATQLYNAGYGKITASEVAREILDFICIYSSRDVMGDVVIKKERYLELRMKYLGECGE